jgi:hypothetical protein
MWLNSSIKSQIFVTNFLSPIIYNEIKSAILGKEVDNFLLVAYSLRKLTNGTSSNPPQHSLNCDDEIGALIHVSQYCAKCFKSFDNEWTPI